jgi:hypothetical protein
MRGNTLKKKNVKRRYIHGNDSFDGFGKKDIKKAIKKLEKTFEIISISDAYPNRNSKEVRVYVKSTKLIIGGV